MLAPLYGGGALLIRKSGRRWGLGWPSMIALCFAYGLIEEAFVTQSLFNPNYVGLRLLDYGYIPRLGNVGLAVTAVLFVIACAVLFFFQLADFFMATSSQFIVSAVIVALLVALAFGLRPRLCRHAAHS